MSIEIVELDKLLNELDKRFDALQIKQENATFAKVTNWPVTLKKASKITGTPINTLKGYIRTGILERNQLKPGGLLFLSPEDLKKAILLQKNR